MDKVGLKIDKSSQQKAPDFIIVNRCPTNDLSSRMRIYLSCLVFQENLNKTLGQTRLIKSEAKDKLSYSLYEMYDKLHGRNINLNDGKRVTNPPVLYLLGTDISSGKQKELWKSTGVDYRDVVAPLGISIAQFFIYDLHTNKWSYKKFFNEIPLLWDPKDTSKFLWPFEEKEKEIPLLNAYITNPFDSIVGMAGFNEHARLILQY
jgi:hypothetical protein